MSFPICTMSPEPRLVRHPHCQLRTISLVLPSTFFSFSRRACAVSLLPLLPSSIATMRSLEVNWASCIESKRPQLKPELLKKSSIFGAILLSPQSVRPFSSTHPASLIMSPTWRKQIFTLTGPNTMCQLTFVGHRANLSFWRLSRHRQGLHPLTFRLRFPKLSTENQAGICQASQLSQALRSQLEPESPGRLYDIQCLSRGARFMS